MGINRWCYTVYQAIFNKNIGYVLTAFVNYSGLFNEDGRHKANIDRMYVSRKALKHGMYKKRSFYLQLLFAIIIDINGHRFGHLIAIQTHFKIEVAIILITSLFGITCLPGI